MIPPTGPLKLELDLERYETLAAERGWTTHEEHARGLQLSMATVSRLRAGIQPPGSKVVSEILRAFPGETFDSLFTIVKDDRVLRSA